jgi:hypothetical protein
MNVYVGYKKKCEVWKKYSYEYKLLKKIWSVVPHQKNMLFYIKKFKNNYMWVKYS